MQAMVFPAAGSPLEQREVPRPTPSAGQLLLRVLACGVCRTDLHVLDGELTEPKLPLIPGHEIVGRVEALGPGVDDVQLGARMGVPWLGWTCGECSFCRRGEENLCDRARFTGYQLDGGYAQYVVADRRFCFPIPERYDDVHAAPLLCAGLIGYRSLRMAGEARKIGFYGFGAAAHILVQIAAWQGREVFAFARPGDAAGEAFARSMGAVWAGPSDQPAPDPLDAAIIFAPVGGLVPQALRAVRKGGTVVCAGIHMSDIPAMPYEILWGERTLRSVANLTRRDGDDFMQVAAQIELHTKVSVFSLAEANRAIEALRAGEVHGAAVLVPG